jgi:hypothetical protein
VRVLKIYIVPNSLFVRYTLKNKMFRLPIFILSLFLLISCNRHETKNTYLESKHHPSEQISNENKKAAKKAQHDFLKTQKKNNKAIGKHGSIWTKKKKQYTN